MLVETKWDNRTVRHPDGVREGAALTWLKTIKATGIVRANRIQATDCDAAQTRCDERGFSGPDDLAAEIGEVPVVNFVSSTFLTQGALSDRLALRLPEVP